jgi:hypothetical protein
MPRLSEEQFQKVRELNLIVAQISDGLGSESSDPGLLYLTRVSTLAGAARQLMPASFQVLPLDASALGRDYLPPGDERAGALRSLMAMSESPPVAALCGGASFRPQASSRGAFYVLLFLNLSNSAGFRALVAFSRAET